MTAYLAQEFLCPHCTFVMGIACVENKRIYVYCQTRTCIGYRKVGSYPISEVHLQPEETNG